MKVGVAFSRQAQGDLRTNLSDRKEWAARIGAPEHWATVSQIHGAGVVEASAPDGLGEADGIFTTTPGLGLAVFTADCAGVVIAGENGVGVAHAGWRGTSAGVVPALVEEMRKAGIDIVNARIGPAIGPCCFEVGDDVASQFPGFVRSTTWGSPSVDLAGLIRTQLAPVEIVEAGDCTFHNREYWSHRRDGAVERMATLVWLG